MLITKTFAEPCGKLSNTIIQKTMETRPTMKTIFFSHGTTRCCWKHDLTITRSRARMPITEIFAETHGSVIFLEISEIFQIQPPGFLVEFHEIPMIPASLTPKDFNLIFM